MTTPAGESVVVALLGEIALRRDGVLNPVPGARSRLLLTSLALRAGRSRSAAALIDDVWGEQPPRAPMNALHTQVSRLRSVLPDGALDIGPAGYRLTLDPDRIDLSLANELLDRARQARASGDAVGALETVAAARELWRGEPGADLPAGEVAIALGDAAAAHAAAFDELELRARRDLGDIDGALRLARRRVERDPLDETAELTLMRLLAAAGRANEALESFAAFRAGLAERLGTDPGPALIALNTAILRGDPVTADDHRPTREPAGAIVRVEARPALVGPGNGSGRGSAADPPDSADLIDQPARAAIGLRAAPNALLGREHDLEAIERLLRTARVTTVLGPGGTGKTRVANEVGSRVAGSGQVVLVELASVRAEAEHARVEVEAAISAALGLSEMHFDSAALRAGYTVDPGRRLREAIAARSLLLILDNCEHLVDAVAVVVADLIGAADRLTVLTTSRAPLMITAETVYPLPPLTIDAAGSPATELFAARARAVRPSVRLDPDIVAQLCRTLDGLPLAIELAAARVRAMSVEEINSRLADRFALLRHGDRSSPERHRTLHAVIDWSWNLLDEPQRIVLRRLCRFPGGFGVRAAEQVAGGPEVGDVLAAVDGLVNQSLLTVIDDEVLGTRYRMLETVREYGEEQLAAAEGEADLVIERIMAWARDFATEAADSYLVSDQMRLALAITTELDNLLAALRYALERGDARTAYTVFPVVGMLWMIRGTHAEVESWAVRVIALDESGTGSDAARPDLIMISFQMVFLHLFFAPDGPRFMARVRSRVRRLLRGPYELSETSRFVGAIMIGRADGRGIARLVAEAIVFGSDETKATALLLRANAKENMGDVRGSTRDAIRALAMFGERHVWSVAMVCRHLGQVFGQIAAYADSAVYYERSLGLLLRLGVFEDTIEIRSLLAASLIGTGQLDRARHVLEVTVGGTDIGVTVNSTGMPNHLLAGVAQSAAELSFARGDVEEGLRRYDRALELVGWPELGAGPGPGGLMTAAAAADARILCGRARTASTLVRELVEQGMLVLAQYQDLPQIGGMCCAVGSYLVTTGVDEETGLRLLVLAHEVAARQDLPSMRLDLHMASARERLGAERIERVRARYRRIGRKEGAREAVDLLKYAVGHRD
ncbi:AfsR/SARP family transcriptional regulator [Nocardia arizonensis]|uniref:AfsR/SARP family transcriptional regulator n=1 Tax=Nocardia arizonensis TaxID=1141647 RepID=UPI001EF5775D|nr:BTAD domain-containing putative transcriptional regulator [Nocardia arizonensis]